MNSNILILPIIARRSFDDPSWREQYDREREVAMMNMLMPPPRTRPLEVIVQLERKPCS